jgi:hypothetical protein
MIIEYGVYYTQWILSIHTNIFQPRIHVYKMNGIRTNKLNKKQKVNKTSNIISGIYMEGVVEKISSKF